MLIGIGPKLVGDIRNRHALMSSTIRTGRRITIRQSHAGKEEAGWRQRSNAKNFASRGRGIERIDDVNLNQGNGQITKRASPMSSAPSGQGAGADSAWSLSNSRLPSSADPARLTMSASSVRTT